MKNSTTKNRMTFVFLALFFFMKIAGFHEFTHTDDDNIAEHCAICDSAVINNVMPVLFSDIHDFSIIDTKSFYETPLVIRSQFLGASAVTKTQLFSRPPPYLL